MLISALDMEMFNNLREFINMNVKSMPTVNQGKSTSNQFPPQINLDAGADLLSHFCQQWQELHENNETNARAAQKTAEIISNIHAFILRHNANISKLNQQLSSSPPTLQSMLETCNKQIQQLYTSFELLEEKLINLEGIVDEIELERKKVDHKYQLALYEAKRRADLETLREALSSRHAQLVSEKENKRKQTMHERQKVFQDAFKDDLEMYKALGAIPKIPIKSQPSALLEEIQLDIDDKELLEFLDEK